MSSDSNLVDFDVSEIKVEPVFYPDDLIESDDGNSNLMPEETSSSGEVKKPAAVQDTPQVETESASAKRVWEVTDEPPKSDRRYTCLRCGFVTEIDDELRNHMVHQHAEIIRAEGPPKTSKLPYVTIPRRFICSICRKLLDSSTALAEHLKTHDATTKVKTDAKKVLQCDKCNFVTPSMKKFRKHTMRVHTGERPFKCDMCDYAAIDSAGLRKHRHRTHKKAERDSSVKDAKPKKIITKGTASAILQTFILIVFPAIQAAWEEIHMQIRPHVTHLFCHRLERREGLNCAS